MCSGWKTKQTGMACDECTKKCFNLHGNRKSVGSSSECVSFFKIMLGEFETSLFLPPGWSCKVLKPINQVAYLEDSEGRSWTVEISIIKNLPAFKEGWHKFIEDHNIKIGEFLVFKYLGSLRFSVQIFGKSGRERVQFLVNERCNASKRKRNREVSPSDHFYSRKSDVSNILEENPPVHNDDSNKRKKVVASSHVFQNGHISPKSSCEAKQFLRSEPPSAAKCTKARKGNRSKPPSAEKCPEAHKSNKYEPPSAEKYTEVHKNNNFESPLAAKYARTHKCNRSESSSAQKNTETPKSDFMVNELVDHTKSRKTKMYSKSCYGNRETSSKDVNVLNQQNPNFFVKVFPGQEKEVRKPDYDHLVASMTHHLFVEQHKLKQSEVVQNQGTTKSDTFDVNASPSGSRLTKFSAEICRDDELTPLSVAEDNCIILVTESGTCILVDKGSVFEHCSYTASGFNTVDDEMNTSIYEYQDSFLAEEPILSHPKNFREQTSDHPRIEGTSPNISNIFADVTYKVPCTMDAGLLGARETCVAKNNNDTCVGGGLNSTMMVCGYNENHGAASCPKDIMLGDDDCKDLFSKNSEEIGKDKYPLLGIHPICSTLVPEGNENSFLGGNSKDVNNLLIYTNEASQGEDNCNIRSFGGKTQINSDPCVEGDLNSTVIVHGYDENHDSASCPKDRMTLVDADGKDPLSKNGGVCKEIGKGKCPTIKSDPICSALLLECNGGSFFKENSKDSSKLLSSTSEASQKEDWDIRSSDKYIDTCVEGGCNENLAASSCPKNAMLVDADCKDLFSKDSEIRGAENASDPCGEVDLNSAVYYESHNAATSASLKDNTMMIVSSCTNPFSKKDNTMTIVSACANPFSKDGGGLGDSDALCVENDLVNVMTMKLQKDPYVISNFQLVPKLNVENVERHLTEKVWDVKSETTNSDILPPSDPIMFSFPLSADLQSWHELSEPLPSKKKRYERRVVFFRDSLARVWPILYHENPRFVGFLGGWYAFASVQNIEDGDICMLEMVDESDSTFNAIVCRKGASVWCDVGMVTTTPTAAQITEIPLLC